MKQISVRDLSGELAEAKNQDDYNGVDRLE